MEATELHQQLKHVDTGVCRYTLEKCEEFMPSIAKIRELKKKHNAIILAHTYVNPEIIYGVADEVGDSYYLSKKALESDAEMIFFVSVRFMAETAKILSPSKRVFQTSSNGGCSLADSITGEQVAELRRRHPEHTFICYINTTAEVKAQCDISVTSSNVYGIIENLENDKVFFLPDRLMAQNVIGYLKAKGVEKEILYSDGSCYVHETYDPEMIDYLRVQNPGLSVAVHPECAPGVTGKADYVGSTSGIHEHVRTSDHASYLLVTECGLSSRLRVEHPEKKIVGSCTFCRYMQANTLETLAETMESLDPQMEILLDQDVMSKARTCIDRMFEETDRQLSPQSR